GPPQRGEARDPGGAEERAEHGPGGHGRDARLQESMSDRGPTPVADHHEDEQRGRCGEVDLWTVDPGVENPRDGHDEQRPGDGSEERKPEERPWWQPPGPERARERREAREE